MRSKACNSNVGRSVIVAALVALPGCAGQHVKLAEADRKTLTTETVYAVHVEPHQAFRVESTGYRVAGAMFPLVAIAQAAEGMDMASKLGLQDPVVRVKERLAGVLENQYQSTVKRVDQPASRLNPNASYKTFERGLVLEVRTNNWGVDNNRAKYAATARMLRPSDGTVLWEARCTDSIADREKPSPSTEALQANSGELLKLKLGEAAEACADQLAAWAIETAQSR